LEGSFEVFKNIIDGLELSAFPRAKNKCEPFLTKRKMYPSISKGYLEKDLKNLLDILAYSNGKRSIFQISLILNLDLKICLSIIKKLKANNLID
jgi:aminopeptidase-like protein